MCENSLALANFSRRVLGVLLANMEKRVHSLQHMTAKEKYQELLTEHPDILLRAPLGISSYRGSVRSFLIKKVLADISFPNP
ncbi:hypothetical protein [Moheibacter lacus]|uniref:Uncharacterized protein n=1 Tax=Moheibacter lacus TaxID=2745851 RepID=A0A838ZMV9_9FLAO|nr:hypothetical protein [Moheibacter lacus]MBA5629904.1 hypothetical protein [Moheibacter lacus]